MSDKVQALATHNAAREDARKNHGSSCGPLTWDDKLAADAQVWANHMAQIQQMIHSTGDKRPGEGENLYSYMGTNAQPNFNDAAKGWISEKPLFPGGNFGAGNWESYGHYTQCVWPSTTRVGMAIAKGSNGWFYVCGRYSPVGNFVGQPVWGPGGSGGGSQPSQPSHPGGGHKDGVYLVNSVKDGKWTSGFAYYADIGNKKNGEHPQQYVDIDSNGVVQWEGKEYSGKFPNGNVFKVHVNSDGQQKANGTNVGSANDNAHGFSVYKDDGHVLYEIDGWQVHAIYRAA